MRKSLYVLVVIISTIMLLPFVFVFIPFLIILAPIAIAALIDLFREPMTKEADKCEVTTNETVCTGYLAETSDI